MSERATDALQVEHAIQRGLVERLQLDWPPGETFYGVIEDELRSLRTFVMSRGLTREYHDWKAAQ